MSNKIQEYLIILLVFISFMSVVGAFYMGFTADDRVAMKCVSNGGEWNRSPDGFTYECLKGFGE